ncbi:hypothetical protein MFLAVUS_007749 [Mucor flavus]|uniref:Uncharacterized protein n=1 Tax=Mucor flavus TaxID=439312 RepID=A0ABP9Z567_9FUNG
MTKLKEGSGVKTTTVKHLFGLDIDRLNKYKDLPEAIKSNLGHLADYIKDIDWKIDDEYDFWEAWRQYLNVCDGHKWRMMNSNEIRTSLKTLIDLEIEKPVRGTEYGILLPTE